MGLMLALREEFEQVGGIGFRYWNPIGPIVVQFCKYAIGSALDDLDFAQIDEV